MDGYLEALKKFAVFDGRASRKEYWYFVLFHFMICMVLLVVASADASGVLVYVCAGYWLAGILPSLAVSVRRLHDTGHSGAWLLIGLIPFGGIVLLVFKVQDSTPGMNQYGPNPKEEL